MRRSRPQPRRALERRLRRRLAHPIGCEEMIVGGIAQGVEESPAAVRVAPALRMHALAVLAPIEELGPLLVAALGRLARPGDMRLPAVDELELGAHAAVRTVDQQHGAGSLNATAAAAASSM